MLQKTKNTTSVTLSVGFGERNKNRHWSHRYQWNDLERRPSCLDTLDFLFSIHLCFMQMQLTTAVERFMIHTKRRTIMSQRERKKKDILMLLPLTALSFADPITDILTLKGFHSAGHNNWFVLGCYLASCFLLFSVGLFSLKEERRMTSLVRNCFTETSSFNCLQEEALEWGNNRGGLPRIRSSGGLSKFCCLWSWLRQITNWGSSVHNL